MDSPISERTRSKLKRKAQESKIISSKRARFYESYRHQRFALPDSIMHYIAMNPSSPEVYQKLTYSCKDFFIKNSILVFSSLCYRENEWITCINGIWKKVDLNNVSSKIWINGDFFVCPSDVNDRTAASTFIKKISYFNVKDLYLSCQTISLNELMLFSSNVEQLSLYKCNVLNSDGSVVALEKIVESFPKVRKIIIICTLTASDISSTTFAELLKIPQFLTLDSFKIWDIPEEFDLEGFYTYMKTNMTTTIVLDFANTISDAYKTRLESIIDEIIEAGKLDYKPPIIRFVGLNREKFGKLQQIFLQR